MFNLPKLIASIQATIHSNNAVKRSSEMSKIYLFYVCWAILYTFLEL